MTDQTDIQFEREKWKAELELRKRELELKERDIQFEREKWKAELELRKRELDLKERDSVRARWSNPLALAIFAAALAALGNAGVSWLNGNAQRDVEIIRANSETDKEQATEILEAIKTGDPEKAAANLGFLVKAHVIPDPMLRSAVTNYLDQRKPGEGPMLPPSSPAK
jgi:hypothetical protein